MEDTSPYVAVDQALIIATSLALGEGKREVAESLVNQGTYEGRRLSVKARVPGSLGRGDAGFFYQDIWKETKPIFS